MPLRLQVYNQTNFAQYLQIFGTIPSEHLQSTPCIDIVETLSFSDQGS